MIEAIDAVLPLHRLGPAGVVTRPDAQEAGGTEPILGFIWFIPQENDR